MIRVLIVEDEPLIAEAHRAYVGRVPGFTAVAVAGSGREAMRAGAPPGGRGAPRGPGGGGPGGAGPPRGGGGG
ncbi:response regulator, partial [Nocardia farcinica]|uniref:response regulator n=1 Tax=Nocardia farcinica TaxID=37329 RepID=UPI003CC7ED53